MDAEPTTRGAVGRVLHAFANAVLERTLPTLRAWLQGKLGEGASVESMELDGSRVHLHGVRLPIGPSAVLEVERATFLASPGDLASGMPPLRMEHLRGRLVTPGDEGQPLRFCAPLTLEGREPPTGREWVHGLVTVRGATWTASVGDAEGQSPLSGTITLSVTSSQWELTSGIARVADATIELSGRGRLDDPARGLDRARLDAHDARVGHLIDGLAALAGKTPRIGVPLPWTGRCDGSIEVDSDRVRAAFDVRTDASTLRIEGEGTRAGTIDGARVSGSLAWPDLLPASVLDQFAASAEVSVEGHVRGAFDALEGELTLCCERLAVKSLREPAKLVCEVTLGGDRTADALIGVTFLRGAGQLEIAATLEREGLLSGRIDGRVDPAVVDLGDGLFSGDVVAISGTIGGTLRAPIVTAGARAARLSYRRAGTDVELEAFTFAVELDEALRVSAGARLGSGMLTVDLRAREARVARVDAASAIALARLASVGWLRLGSEPTELATFAIPDDAEIDARLDFSEGIVGDVLLKTPRSSITVDPLVYREGRFDGTRIRGRLAARDALDAGLFPGSVRPAADGAVELDLAMNGSGVGTWVEGRIFTASLVWFFFEGVPGVTLSAGASGLRVDRDAVTLTELEGNVLGGRIELTARIAYPDAEGPSTPTGTLELRNVREGFGAWLMGALGADRLPGGLSLDAALESDEEGRLRGPIVIANERSRMTLAICLGARGSIEGSALSGELSLMDVYELIPRGGPTIVGKGNAELHAVIEGDVRAPRMALEVVSDAPRLMVASGGNGLRIGVDRVLARVSVSLERLLVSELIIDGYGGRLKAQGLYGWGSGFRGVQAKIELDDVSVGELPKPGEGKVGQLLTGRLQGTLTIKKDAGERLGGKGEIWIESPTYPLLRRAGPALGKYGLRPPPIAGTEALIAEVRGNTDGWLLRGISGAVRGASIDGDVAIKHDGTLLGALDVALEAAYLRTSALLHVPATMAGDLKIPVRLRGPLAAPQLQADLLGTLDNLVSKSAIGRGIHRAVDRVMDGVLGETDEQGQRRRHERADDLSLLDTQALIERIAKGIGDEDRLLEALIERGLSPDEIATRIDDAQETNR